MERKLKGLRADVMRKVTQVTAKLGAQLATLKQLAVVSVTVAQLQVRLPRPLAPLPDMNSRGKLAGVSIPLAWLLFSAT